MPNWIDASIAVVFAGALYLEIKRGFGKAVFDLAALLIGLRITWMLNEPLSESLHLAADPATNQAVLCAAAFVVTGGALVFIGMWAHATTLVSTEVFEPVLGALCGVGIAVIAAHVLVQTVALGAGDDAVPVAVANSLLGTEFLRFGTYHQVLELLYNFHREPVG